MNKPLTRRQRQVVLGAAHGEQRKHTAERLGLCSDTVKIHRELARKALGAKTMAQAVAILIATDTDARGEFLEVPE